MATSPQMALEVPSVSGELSSREAAMTPNQITALRVLMAFAAVALFGHGIWADLAALALTVLAIALDAVDGYLARRKNLATPLGAQLDILGDRVVENVYFTYFAVCGQVSLWVPLLFFVRGTLTDFLRSLAARRGKLAFGKNSMLESRWAQALVGSRASRAAYAALKCACFCYLGVRLTLVRSSAAGLIALGHHWMDALLLGSQVLVAATVAFCVVRGVPVFWEGRRYLAAQVTRGRTALVPAGSVPGGAAAARRGLGLPA